MNKFMFSQKTATLLFLAIMVFFPLKISIAAPESVQPLAAKTELSFESGKLNGTITNSRIEDVCLTLKKLSGLRYTFTNPADTDWKITKILRLVDLNSAIKDIFSGFSYALIKDSARFDIIILSKLGNSSNNLNINGNKTETQAEKEIPTTLEKFRPIIFPQTSIAAPRGTLEDLASQGNIEYYQAILQRAIDALRSPNQNLYSEAISQLGGLSDPAAGDFLAEWIMAGDKDSTQLRLQALTAFIQFNRYSGYSNIQHVRLLESLTQSNDASISRTAEQALNEMKNVNAR